MAVIYEVYESELIHCRLWCVLAAAELSGLLWEQRSGATNASKIYRQDSGKKPLQQLNQKGCFYSWITAKIINNTTPQKILFRHRASWQLYFSVFV